MSAWQCPYCGVHENPGPPDRHECDPRSVVRVQVASIVSKETARDLDRWFNLTGKRGRP